MDYFSHLVLFFRSAIRYPLPIPDPGYELNDQTEVKTMALISFFVALYLIASLCESVEAVCGAFSAWMASPLGTMITIIVFAYLAYRWYRARYMA